MSADPDAMDAMGGILFGNVDEEGKVDDNGLGEDIAAALSSSFLLGQLGGVLAGDDDDDEEEGDDGDGKGEDLDSDKDEELTSSLSKPRVGAKAKTRPPESASKSVLESHSQSIGGSEGLASAINAVFGLGQG